MKNSLGEVKSKLAILQRNKEELQNKISIFNKKLGSHK
jgi:hypothetical protein